MSGQRHVPDKAAEAQEIPSDEEKGANSGKKRRRRKKVTRDPNKPKRPPSACMLCSVDTYMSVFSTPTCTQLYRLTLLTKIHAHFFDTSVCILDLLFCADERAKLSEEEKKDYKGG